ncbi:hypothetical protein [Labilibaculum euxinus]
MKKRKTSIQKLKEFARQSNRNIDFSVKHCHGNALNPLIYNLRNLYIPNNGGENSYFVCFGDSRKINEKSTFSGVFFPISMCRSAKILIRKKNIKDIFNPFLLQSDYKTGTESFDSQVVIEEFDSIGTNNIFKNLEIQELICNSLEFDKRLKIGVNLVNTSFVPSLINRSHFGIFTTDRWFVEPEKIETLFSIAEEIRSHIIQIEEPKLELHI